MLDSLKIINSKMLSSFFRKTLLKNHSINEIKDFKSYIFKLSCKLEQRFAFRLDHITRQTSKNIANILQDIFIFVNDEKILEEFKNFYQRYILNSFIQNYFKNTQIASLLHPNFEINMILLLNKFNSFYLEYSKSVEQIYDTVFKNYSNKILKHFYFKDSDLIKKTLQIYITDLLYNKTNSILLILFPELKFLIEKTTNSHKINILYTRIHFFFSLLVCKLNFNLLNLKYEFDNSKYLNEFLITDSKFVNLFVLEMRLFICVSCLTVLDNLKEIKLIFLKAFASFIRCFDHNFLNYFLFHEFCMFDYLKGVDNHIRIHSNAYEHGLKATKKGFKKVPDFDIQFISTSLISADFLGLNEMERVEKLILVIESRVEDHPKILRMNIGFVQRITEFLFEYFKELD